MPESKSKRKKKGRRPRPPSVQTPPKKRKTPRWVPPAFFICMGAGVLLILATYVFLDGRPLTLFTGLGLMGLAFIISTRWY